MKLLLALAFSLVLGALGWAQLSSGSKTSDLDAFKNAKFGSATAPSGGNLIPNWNMSDPTPLKSFRIDFPYQEVYVDNAKYVTQVNKEGKNCAQIDMPEHRVGAGGGKVETALVPVEPGATYRAEVMCMTNDFAAKIFAECYCEDPRSDEQKAADGAKGPTLTITRIPAMEGHKALAEIYRAQFPDPPTHSKKWDKVQKEFTLPLEWKVAGKNVPPAFLNLRAVVYDATEKAGKSYFTEFKLVKIKDPGANTAPKTSGPASDKNAVIR